MVKHRYKQNIVAALLAAATLAVAGCGGDDEAETGTPESSVPTERTITDPRDAFKEDPGGGRGPRPSEGPSRDGAPGPTESDRGAQSLSEAEVRGVIKRFITSDDPSDCDLATEALLNRNFGGSAGCRQLAKQGAGADSVEFVELAVDGTEAEATIMPRGGVADGLTIDIRVVGVDGEPKLDSFDAGVAPGP